MGAHATEPNRVYETNCALCHQKSGVGLRGVQIVGVMPSFAALSDDDLASVLNYATHLDEWGSGGEKRPRGLSSPQRTYGQHARVSSCRAHWCARIVIHRFSNQHWGRERAPK